ncbi:CBS domain-containing protein [Paracoccus sp. p4-l81]|uniref:CBS domain-containing protein n=1 Tax=unclassified Paracoccus (in: a-proteobacteria) TaxID=2688777 RepID=UPI0035B78082
MLVQNILSMKAEKGASEAAITVRPGSLVSEAAALLSRHRIGAVIVSPDGLTVAGILSERDIVRELGKSGAAALSMPVDDLMTRKVAGCARSDSALAVLERMTEGRFRHMPVMEDDRMIDVISIGDAVAARLKQLAMENRALEGMIMGA